MRLSPFLALVTVALASGCDATSTISDDFAFTLPGGLIGSGSTVSVALENASAYDATAGALPCTVEFEQRIHNKWVSAGPPGPCPAVITTLPMGETVSFPLPVPDRIGTFRLATRVAPEGRPTIVVRSEPFQTVGIRLD